MSVESPRSNMMRVDSYLVFPASLSTHVRLRKRWSACKPRGSARVVSSALQMYLLETGLVRRLSSHVASCFFFFHFYFDYPHTALCFFPLTAESCPHLGGTPNRLFVFAYCRSALKRSIRIKHHKNRTCRATVQPYSVVYALRMSADPLKN